MVVKFAFEQSHSPVLGIVRRPVANVQFQTKASQLWQGVWMIVDSGADYTILPRFMAAKLDVQVERDCKVFHTSGIGGTEKVYFLPEIRVRLGEMERTVPVGFIDRNEVPPLMGRHLCMETFETYFSSDHITHFSDKPFLPS